MRRSSWRAVVVILVFAAVSAVHATITSGRTRQAPNSRDIAISRSETRPHSQGSAENFTGSVRIQSLFDAREPSRANGASVTFEPGARTAWHTHPLGQTLIVTAGAGRVARWGEPARPIAPGDVIWIPPGQKHWHGASPSTALTHIAIQEHEGGKAVEWLEHVTDEQYRK